MNAAALCALNWIQYFVQHELTLPPLPLLTLLLLLQHATWVWGSNNNKLLNNKVFCCYSLLTVAFYGAAHFIRFSSLRFASFYFACFLFSPSRLPPFPLLLRFFTENWFSFYLFQWGKGRGVARECEWEPKRCERRRCCRCRCRVATAKWTIELFSLLLCLLLLLLKLLSFYFY